MHEFTNTVGVRLCGAEGSPSQQVVRALYPIQTTAKSSKENPDLTVKIECDRLYLGVPFHHQQALDEIDGVIRIRGPRGTDRVAPHGAVGGGRGTQTHRSIQVRSRLPVDKATVAGAQRRGGLSIDFALVIGG